MKILIIVFCIILIGLSIWLIIKDKKTENFRARVMNNNSKSLSKNFQWCYNPSYPWSIPRVSLPSCLGLLPEYQMEWWFYVGYLLDDRGVYHTVEFTVIRTGIGSPIFQTVNGGIKVGDDKVFVSSDSFGFGASTLPGSSLYVPTVTDNKYQVTFVPNIGTDILNFQLKDGIVGQPDTTYNITAIGSNYEFNFDIQDIFGGRMEGINGWIGVVGGDGNNSSYEYCFPWNKVLKGGTMNFNGTKSNIVDGWMWLDRQVVTYKDGEGPLANILPNDMFSKPQVLHRNISKTYTLYTGNWIACILPSLNLSFYLACGWPSNDKKGQQWVVGDESGIKPLWSLGAVWESFNSNPQGYEIGEDFSLNIKDPKNPKTSPHWISSNTGNTYCSSWKVTFKKDIKGLPKTLYFEYFRPDCETVPLIGSAFMECCARVYTDFSSKKQIGWGWVEQMGLN